MAGKTPGDADGVVEGCREHHQCQTWLLEAQGLLLWPAMVVEWCFGGGSEVERVEKKREDDG